MKRPEKIVTRHYGNGIINAAPSDRGFSHRSNAIFESEYTRSDIADARVAAAHERAANIVERAGHSLHVELRALTSADAKAALEQVRREARRNALLDAVAACRPHADDCALDRQAKAQCADMIQRLLDNPQEDKT